MLKSKELKEQTASLKKDLNLSQFDRLLLVSQEAIAKVGLLTEDKVKLTALCEKANKNTDDAMETAKNALAGAKELMSMLDKVREERDRYKTLRDIDAYRIKNATKTIDELEAEIRELKPNWETV